jgi:hypothetical protein
MGKKTNSERIIEIINYVQKFRKDGLDFDSISGKLAELNVELEVRWNAIDTVKRQEENCNKILANSQKPE